MKNIHIPVAVAFSALSLLLGGCGYRCGNLMHPQIKTVAIAPVVNETLAYNAAPQVRALLCERFQTDGSLKLVDEKNADCIVYARVTNVRYNEVSWSKTMDDDKFEPNQWRVSISIQYTVMLPGRANPLINQRDVSGSALFTSGPDLEISRSSALRQAAFEASKNIVTSVTEAW